MSFEKMQQHLSHQQQRIERYIKRWLPLLNLDRWAIVVDYKAQPCEDDPNTTAIVRCSWQYLTGFLTFYLPEFGDYPDGKVEMIVLHELCHLLVNEMKRLPGEPDDHEERTVTELAKAFLNVRHGGKARTRAGIKKTVKVIQ